MSSNGVNILIVGSGAREHALAWKIIQSPLCDKLFIAPGNSGTALHGENVALDVWSNQKVVDFAKKEQINLVVIGADDYLEQGMVDALQDAGIPAFGPTKAAARLEWSKAFAKEFMQKHNIPTARSETFTSFDMALQRINILKQGEYPVVIKADGLALGKGVVIAETREEAEKTLRAFMEEGILEEAGKTVIIEEYLEGNEVSVHAWCDGETAQLFPIARDHKRIGEGNTGLNTGGMGTIAPVEASQEFLDEIRDRVVLPVIRGMKEVGTPFKGILFPGVMVTKDGIKVLEFNARFGDPECESYMRLLESDIVPIMLSCVGGTLPDTDIQWANKFATTVMLASGGYPGNYEKGFGINGLDQKFDDSVVVFHAGVKKTDEGFVTNGGRVVGVSAVSDTKEDARKQAFSAAQAINFEGKQYRKDIGANWAL